MLFASKVLPAGVAAILARQGTQTVVALADDLTVPEVLAAENLAFSHGGAAVVILRQDLPSAPRS